jgi:His-Xaa-Ser system radical SAM maturase HxsB
LALTFHDSGFLDREYTLNYFSTKKLDDDRFLVTTDHGAWIVLSKGEYDLLRLERVEEDPNLFSALEQKCIVLTKDNINDAVRAYAERFHFLFRPPTLHIVTPTMRCNSSCVYCHSMVKEESARGFDMDEETANAIVDFILRTPTRSLVIEFQGGDCLLNYPIVEHMMDYGNKRASAMGKTLKFRLVTNLTLMNDDILKSLAKRKLMGISTSLDGPREIHDKNRRYLGGRGTYDDVVHWIRRIKTEWKHDFNLRALTTVTRDTLAHGRELVDEYINLGFDGIFLRYLNNIGFAKRTWKSIGYTADEYLGFWDSTLDYIIKVNQKTPFFEQLSFIFLKKILQRWDPMYVDIQSPCGAAIGQLLYTFNGDIHTCDEGKLFPELRLGNVRTTTYRDVFRSKTVRSMVDISSRQGFLCDSCVWNPYCGLCPIYTHSSQGTTVSKLAMDDRCRINSHILDSLFRRMLLSGSDRRVLFSWFSNQDIMR